jgi:hypothetical protein
MSGTADRVTGSRDSDAPTASALRVALQRLKDRGATRQSREAAALQRGCTRCAGVVGIYLRQRRACACGGGGRGRVR